MAPDQVLDTLEAERSSQGLLGGNQRHLAVMLSNVLVAVAVILLPAPAFFLIADILQLLEQPQIAEDVY